MSAVPRVTSSLIAARLLTTHPAVLQEQFGRLLEERGPEVLGRLFDLATKPDVSERLALTAIEKVIELSGLKRFSEVLAEQMAKRVAKGKAVLDVGEEGDEDDEEEDLAKGDRVRYKRLLRDAEGTEGAGPAQTGT